MKSRLIRTANQHSSGRKPWSMLLAAAISGAVFGFAQPAFAVKINSATFGGVTARALGPAVMSGRIAAIDAVADDSNIIYIGSASGGVWQSKDGGITFRPIFDDHTQSIGAIRVDQSNPDRVWIGTGESWVRNTVSVGDGVYRSDNGGETWKHLGLEDTEHIAAIRLHPYNSDTAWVCATGHLWDDNEQRGVFKTTDGGENWEKVLYIDQETGCADIDVDHGNPNILYAAMWHFRRYPDFFQSGGETSGLYRSVDGGNTWQEMTEGLPEGDLGRMAVATAPSRPGTVYANVESDKTALFRSEDMGVTWTEQNSSTLVQLRPFYFSELVVDPVDHDRIYKPSLSLGVSTDGGETFSSLFSGGFGGGIHPDHHALWINPNNPKHMLLGTDGGVYESRDQTGHWRHIGTLPVSQFYHVSVDQQWPYNVYGGLQDNGSWRGPSRAQGGIRNKDWDSVGFGDGFWTFADPTDNSIVFSEFQGGQLRRVDTKMGEVKEIAPAKSGDEEDLRFNWNTPLHLSSNKPGRIYYGSQYVHISDDRGESWTTISPDLTTDDPKRQRQKQSGGLSIDNSTAENNATIYSISESPANAQVIWVGSDDGLVHVTQNGGDSWTNVTKNLPGIPKNTWVSRVEASPHDAGTAFITLDGHRTGDMSTYVLVTRDFGKSWTSLSEGENNRGIEGYAWVIKQDLVNPELLFLGTEMGLYISLDGGEQWARFKENLPKVAVHDIVIHPTEHDLVLGTHGRGVYIIDDITPMRALTREIIDQNVALLPARPAVMVSGGALQEFSANDQYTAFNPSEAATITYWLKKRHLFGDIKVNVYDQNDELIISLPGEKRPGINRVEWPMRLKAPKLPAATALAPAFIGPRVPEGEYRIELVKGKETLSGTVELVADPRTQHSAEDRKIQQELALRLYGMLGDLTYISESVTSLADKAKEHAETLDGRDAKRLNAFAETVNKFNSTLVSTSKAGWLSGDEQLREKISNVYGTVNTYDGRPTDTQMAQTEAYQQQLVDAEAQAQSLMEKELPKVNRILEKHDLPAFNRMSRDEWEGESEGLRGSAAMSKAQINALPEYLIMGFKAN